MDAFLRGVKRKSTAPSVPDPSPYLQDDDESTDVKLAILASLHPGLGQDVLLDSLLAHDGSVEATSASLADTQFTPPLLHKPSQAVVGTQTSLRGFATSNSTTKLGTTPTKKPKTLSRKGTTLRLYDPEDVAEHTPCSIIHNFLPVDMANDLLREMLEESKTFEKITFKIFDNVVASPHTSTFYVETEAEQSTQKNEYYYNGSSLTDVRRITPQLLRVKPLVREAVNKEIQHRIKTKYPDGQKLKYQSPDPWQPNAAFVNCYNGPQEHVGYHSDHLTYLGPRAVIGSLSLGVAREFRVRKVLPRDSDNNLTDDPDAEGQISIHLPHNSLLVMHSEMQELWKHSIAPAQAIDPHPIAGSRRINVTYRDYKAIFHPKYTPKCKCGIPTVLKVVQKRKENWGRYFWMCHRGNTPQGESCSFFKWADFDDDGNPVWDVARYRKGGRPIESNDTNAMT
ncbi:GRF zinc finger domain-containing protein [Microdochium trichocladiopsis]|uniref:GRF zinc finger domain-containing protein n=1 Tax=Microdochium trichocladiopsis TaxID=1682393 RepID=A0A9P8Y702_9PEZI|nr:GRF zinc finger domain-containing protein [Microdochium trichocladiopsis]KAH7030878.1 GRF zinc finger domain-containing protein [Microdochium trichocladiopsis]